MHNSPWIIEDRAARDLLRITGRADAQLGDAIVELCGYARGCVEREAEPRVLASGMLQYRGGKPVRPRLIVDPGPPARLIEVLPDHEGRTQPYTRTRAGRHAPARGSLREYMIDLESLDAAALQRAIQDDPTATERLLRYLDDRDEQHSGQVSGATLAAVAGQSDGRIWRRWVSGERPFPIDARRVIISAAWGKPADE